MYARRGYVLQAVVDAARGDAEIEAVYREFVQYFVDAVTTRLRHVARTMWEGSVPGEDAAAHLAADALPAAGTGERNRRMTACAEMAWR